MDLYNEKLHDEEMGGAAMQTAPDDLIFYGTKDVARMLHCSPPTAREVMLRYDFPLLRVGRKLRVSKSAFEAWAMERRVQRRDTNEKAF